MQKYLVPVVLAAVMVFVVHNVLYETLHNAKKPEKIG